VLVVAGHDEEWARSAEGRDLEQAYNQEKYRAYQREKYRALQQKCGMFWLMIKKFCQWACRC
jgi:hypothetical protein